MKAVVCEPICPLMTQPRPDCERADEALFGMVVEVLEQTTPQFWRVRTHYRYEGYAPVDCLLSDLARVTAWEALPKKVVLHKNTCDIQAQPKVQSWAMTTLPRGAVVAPLGQPEDNWQKVALPNGKEGYTRSSFLDTYYKEPGDWSEDELRRRLVDTALLYGGTHYRWGGKTPLGIDCSGLVAMAYLLNGIAIYRDANLVEGFPLHKIAREDCKPGDLLFFPGHVAMYMGDGRYLHSTGKAGSDGFDQNSLNPADPDYREDLDHSLNGVGSYF